MIRIFPHETIERRVIAVCAEDTCGYFGKYPLVKFGTLNDFLVNMVYRPWGVVQYYPLRGARRRTKSERLLTSYV